MPTVKQVGGSDMLWECFLSRLEETRCSKMQGDFGDEPEESRPKIVCKFFFRQDNNSK